MVLTPQLLFSAYCQGVFPMADDQDNILWYDPDPRAILPLDDFYISHSLRRLIRQGRFQIYFDRAFPKVIEACAAPGPGREETWINADIIESYVELHHLGVAHSVETWLDDELVGGLYGVAINGFFAGESMFSKVRNASKVALAKLVEHLQSQGFLLLDVQFVTDHLKKFGAVEIPRDEYHARLARALSVPSTFDKMTPGYGAED